MRTFTQTVPLRTFVRSLREEGKIIGFVPTMGAFHEGHLSLMRRARGECDIVIVSVFVNPLQFDEAGDLEAYPRDENRDMQLASREEVDGVYAPAVEEVYPEGFQTAVEVIHLTRGLEGVHRPGHFRGVATVVTKLLNMVAPDRVYFGQKDYQQLLVVERLVRDLNLSVTVVGCPIVREADGLAMSSRNARLGPEERLAATALNRSLMAAALRLREGTTDTGELVAVLRQVLEAEPLVSVEYATVVDPETLEPLLDLTGVPGLAAIAARVGGVRLIDNCALAQEGVALPRRLSVRI